MGLYSEYYQKISILKHNFEKILKLLQKEKKIEKKIELAMYAANYFVYNNTGYFTSTILENFFVDFAKKIKIDLSNINYRKNSVLHIMSQGYKVGGHTRVVERWIENAPTFQKHSVIFTRKDSGELKVLEENVKNKNGDYISFENELSLEEKAIRLRKLAMEYEFIILHTHMEDPLPIIAFGVEEFTRPVLLYNHASHMAWLGKCVADLVLDIEEDDEITKIKRGISNTYFLGVPSKEILLTKPDKIEIRKKLNLPLDKKIIVTSGGDVRYKSICGNNFTDYLKDIMDEDTHCYVIGVHPNSKAWEKIKKETDNRVITLGYIDFNKGFSEYLKAADLYLDSYPVGGGTAVIDVISSGTPALSLKSVFLQLDYLTKTSAYCQTKEEFITKAKKMLSDKEYANEMYEEVKSSLIEYQSIEAWNRKIDQLLKIMPQKHSVKDLSNEKDYNKIDDLAVMCNFLYNSNFGNEKVRKITVDEIKCGTCYKKIGIPFIFQILFYKKVNSKIRVIKLFNIKIFEYKKKEI